MSGLPSGSLRETEIRPDHLMEEQARRYAEDVRRLLERRAEFVSVPCPACRADQAAFAFEKTGLTYVTCRRCQTMYVNPRPSPALLEHYYRTSENYAYWNRYIFPASEEARREKIFRPRAERIVEICRRHGVAGDYLLEVGPGFGTFCEEAKRTGYFKRVVAVEPVPDLAETCRKRGIEVLEKKVEQARLSEPCDVVASFEVIEHLFSPREFLEGCASCLRPGGLLVVTCPNVKGFDIMVLQGRSSAVDAEHLNYFHPVSLSLLAADCGFQTLEVLTPGRLDAELVRKKALAGEIDLSSDPFLRRVLIDDWEALGGAFQQFLADYGLSSHLWLVARKT